MFKNLIFIILCLFSFLNSAIAMEPTTAISIDKVIVDAQSLLINAAKTNNLALFQQLARNYSEPLAGITSNNQNLLHIAAANNAFDVVKYLVEKLYFDVTKVDTKGNAAIDLAKSNGHIPIVDYLALMWEKQTKKRTAQEEEAEFEALCDQFAQEAQLNCTICLDDKPQADFCTLPCGHQYCTECLNKQLDVAIKAHDSSSLFCPNPKCKRIFDNATLAKITTDKTKITAIDKIQLYESIAKDPNAKHCPTPECKYAFINENKIPVKTQCPECNAEYCSQCLSKHAMSISCENAKNDTANEQWKKQNTKACPQCKVAIEKNEGCLHMTCKQCKHEFCWQCLRPYKEKGHGPYNCSLAPANAPTIATQAEAQDPFHARQRQIEEEYREAEQRRRDEIVRRSNPWFYLDQDNNETQRFLRDVELRLEEGLRRRIATERREREAAIRASAVAAQPARPAAHATRRDNINYFAGHYNPQHERAHIEFARNPLQYISTILQNTDFRARFSLLTQEQRSTWVTRISENPRLAFTSPARLALIWLEQLERIEQSSGRPRRSPYAFISDNPRKFIHINFNLANPNDADPIDPMYIIEFTQKENRSFAWQFLDFIRPFFPENERYFIHSLPYMGEETIEIQRTTLNEREIQAIIDRANAHFAQQQARRSEGSGRE